MRYWKGKHWMVQLTRWAGPVNLGIHLDISARYLDLHLPYLVLTLGNVGTVDYPGCWHCASRDVCTGVKYASHL